MIRTTASQPLRRASKACDHCRDRRVKCQGGRPCDTCRTNRTECVVREKARPARTPHLKGRPGSSTEASSVFPISRVLDTKRFELPVTGSSTGASPPVLPLPHRNETSTSLAPAQSFTKGNSDDPSYASNSAGNPETTAWRHPTAGIEASLLIWCMEQGLSYSSLCFVDECRLANTPATPLPQHPFDIPFEDDLMQHLMLSSDLSFGCCDRDRVFNLYNRYRVLPKSLSEDQLALVYAALCLAKHTRMRDNEEGVVGQDTGGREDLTYFAMAMSALERWNRPSILAVWAYICLLPYTIAHGGMSESRDLLAAMAWQIQELGYHRTDTAHLYPPEDKVDTLLSTFHYADVLMASLDDLRPFIPLIDITTTVDAAQGLFPESVLKTSATDASLQCQLVNNASVTVTVTRHFESIWTPLLRDLRRPRTDMSRLKAVWMEIRVHYMRILLYATQHEATDVLLRQQSRLALSHATCEIIHLYTELQSIGLLLPSWPQLKRISVCCQLLLYSCIEGVIHRLHAEDLFARALSLLNDHGGFRCARAIIVSLCQAAEKLDISVPLIYKDNELSAEHAPVFDFSMDETQNWSDLLYPFDSTFLFGQPAGSIE